MIITAHTLWVYALALWDTAPFGRNVADAQSIMCHDAEQANCSRKELGRQMKMERRNKRKVGRNDPCPCGSGKKYKECCLGKTLLASPNLPSTELANLKVEFANYDQLELIATLGGLQVYPENHSHAIRLEVASRVACSIKNGGTRRVDPNQLQHTLNKYLPTNGAIGMAEDPSENLFTENIVFYGGNYIVYPGITDSGSLILRTLFRSILDQGENWSKKFTAIISAASLSLLALSNEVARRLSHSRYMDSSDTWREDIEVPNASQTGKLCSAVEFTKQEIDALLQPMGLNSTFLTPFIIQVGNRRLMEESLERNPLFIRPLVKMDNKIILVLPGSITGALRHFIWVTSQRYGLRQVLAKKFREILWMDVQENLRLMLFKRIDLDLPPWEGNLPVEEGIFRVDTDKLAYVQLVVDDASDYAEDEPYGTWQLDGLCENIGARHETIAQWLTRGNQPYCRDVFIITVLGIIGRLILFEVKKQPDNTRILLISAADLKVVTQLRDCDNLALWKYAGAKERLLDSTQVPEFSFLDTYAFYLDHHHSFYCSDKKQPDYIAIIPGYGQSLRIKTARMWDIHAALRGNPPNYVTVCRRYEDESIPIYLLEGAIGRSFEQLIEGYTQSIWVVPEDKPKEIPNKSWGTYFEITEMFAYWLWQLTPGLQPHLKPLGSSPIHILFRLEDPGGWGNLAKIKIDKSDSLPKFRSKIDERTIVFTIPSSIQPYLQRANNEGERLILKGLMQSFDDMLDSTGQRRSLHGAKRKRILDTYAPLGPKKKFFIINTEKNASLDPQHLPRLRKLQEHDIEEQLDGLVGELGKKVPPTGEVRDRKRRTELCENIVDVYLQRLRSILPKFAWQPLLEELIAYNEAIWHHRAFTRLTIPTTIECFTDLQSKVESLAEELRDIEATALTARTLVEIITAEPPKGRQELSLDELDKLLAITYHLINWAMISDHIHLGIFNHKLSILDSGRVGVERESIEGIWDPFLRSKTLEKVESAIVGFQSQFELEDESKNVELDLTEYETAFKAEFGLTMTRIVEFYRCLTLLGFRQKTAAPHLRLSEFKNRLEEVLGWSSTEIDSATKLFSLVPRERWEKVPDGFDVKEDIWPWRYNRRLSYIRRPLIIGPEPKDDPIVFWGPRHTEEAGKELLALVMMGRYKLYEHSSEEMKTLIGRIRDEAGKAFTNEVKKWFDENTDWQVELEVPIRPGEALNSQNNLGDIDILAIDRINQTIFSIECKNVNYGRNPREIANEIERFIGDKEGRDLWIEKSLKRDEWLKNNISVLSSVYDLQSGSFKICPFLLTADEIPATYVCDMPLPFISFTRLKRQGVSVLNDFPG